MASVAKRTWTHEGEIKTAWVVRYMAGGKRRSKQFVRKKEADGFLNKVAREVEAGTHVPVRSSLVRTVCDAFLRGEEDRMRDGRIGRNRYQSLRIHLDRSVIPHLGDRLFSSLKPVDVEDFYTGMVRRDGLNPRTARDRVQTLRLVEAFAIRRSYLAAPVSTGTVQALRGIKRAKIRTFTADEVRRLFATARERAAHKWRSSDFLLCAIHLAGLCGLRSGEVFGLTRQNVDFARKVIRVRHSLTAWDELKGPKTVAGNRDVGMPDVVADLLRDWLERHYGENDRELIFRTAFGGRIDGGSLWNMWRGLLTRAGLEHDTDPFRFHALRHFAASWMIENGLSPMDAAALLGHEKFDVTLQVYAHPVLGQSARTVAMDAMARRLAQPQAAEI